MTESEWLTSADPAAMLLWWTGDPRIRGGTNPPLTHPTPRKLRLFACACCRQVWHLLTDDAECGRCKGEGSILAGPGGQVVGLEPHKKCLLCSGTGRINRSRRAVEVAERFADGLATEEERDNADEETSASDPPRFVGVTASESLAVNAANDTSWNCRLLLHGVGDAKDAVQADLLRHIVGNPFRPWRVKVQPEPGNDHHIALWQFEGWDQSVFDLAQALYDGTDCAFALYDALLEAEQAELAEHFKPSDLTASYRDDDDPLAAWHPKGCWALDLILGKE